MHDCQKAEYHYAEFCKALGIDLTKPDTIDTPRRVTRMMITDFLHGQQERDFNFTTFPYKAGEGNGQLVTVTGIRWVSLCAHHHLPIVGVAHVCYLPDAALVGLSKIPRLVKWRASRPTVQEELTQDILDVLQHLLSPKFVGVKLVALHECMACRGVRDYESRTHTNAFWSKDEPLSEFASTKEEFQLNIQEWYAGKGVI